MQTVRFERDQYPRDGGIRSYGFFWGQTFRPGKTVVVGQHWWAAVQDERFRSGTCVRIGFGDLSDLDLIRVAGDLNVGEAWVVLGASEIVPDDLPALGARSVFRAASIIVRPQEILFVDAEPPMPHAYMCSIPRCDISGLF